MYLVLAILDIKRVGGGTILDTEHIFPGQNMPKGVIDILCKAEFFHKFLTKYAKGHTLLVDSILKLRSGKLCGYRINYYLTYVKIYLWYR